MNERGRYIALAVEYRDTASQFARAMRETIDEQIQRGNPRLKGPGPLKDIAHALEQIPRCLVADIARAKRGDAIDILKLRRSYDDYMRFIDGLINSISAAVKVN